MKNPVIFLALLLSYSCLQAQVLSAPPNGDNQKCSVTQQIGGIAKVSVDYSSPDVTSPSGENRTGKIWGQLVPYGLTNLGFGNGNPGPWRAGANENTVIHLSHNMLIEGKPIAAGSYGLHLIAEENGPWTWIFSKNTTQWGSFFYDQAEDALRVSVNPKECPFQDWLTFEFIDRQPTFAVLALKWEHKMIPMRIEVQDYMNLYVRTFKHELQGAAGFNFQNYITASQFCVTNNTHLDQALLWADQAVNAPFIGVRNFNTLQNKAIVLLKMEKADEAGQVIKETIEDPGATSFQIHQLGRQLIGQQQKDKALEVFTYNHTKFNGAWPTNVGMARGLAALGRYQEALPYAEKAYAEAPDELNKNAMKNAVDKLKQNQNF